MSDTSGTPGGHDPQAPVPGPAPYGAPPYGVPEGGPAPWGAPPAGPTPYGQVPYGQTPYHHNPYGAPVYGMPGYGAPLRDPDARPGTVLAAGIVTLVTTGLVLLLLGVVTFFLVAARRSFMEGFNSEADLSAATTQNWFTGILVALLVVMGWCVVTLVLAVFALRRSNAARIALVVCSGLTAALSLVAITGGVSVVTLAASVTVIICLFTGGAGDWYHREHLYSPPRMPKL